MPHPVVYRIALWLLPGLLGAIAAEPARALDGVQAITVAPAKDSPLRLPDCCAVDYSAAELALFDDLADGSLDQHEVLAAALVACGVTESADLSRYETVLAQFVERRLVEGCGELAPRPRAIALLASLHRELLSGGYDRVCTDLATALDEGRFNCVSATILWHCLAERFNLPSEVVELPGHMNARLHLDGQPCVVETTCWNWFDLADNQTARQQALQQVSQLSGAAEADARTLDAAGVIAAIYYNRGIDLLEASRFAEAVAANAKAHRLDPASALARRNLLASVNNWALWLAAQGEHERACQLLAAARNMAPGHEPFQINYIALHQQWIEALISTGRHDDARRIAGRLRADL
jgi:hypothetical protein